MSLNEPILSISVAAKLLNLHPRTLMLYEKSGLIGPHRTETKRRMFSVSDLNDLQFIKFLIQEKGANIQGTKLVLEVIKAAKEVKLDLKKQLFPDFNPQQLI